jgi:regulator of protease activity HflC (stomatin/prohibitin superfamily)
MTISLAFLLFLIIAFLISAIRILNEYERGVIFRLGRVIKTKGPGLIILIPVIDKMKKIDLRIVTLDVPPQDIITRDNVSIKVSAVVYFRVLDSRRAVIEVENFLFATSQLAQTTLRSVCGQAELDERSKVINAEGEFQAARKLADAANIINKAPAALQLRYLQTLREVATENNSTTLFPIPIDLFTPFVEIANRLKSQKDVNEPVTPEIEAGK